jgi:hypothetical protein
MSVVFVAIYVFLWVLALNGASSMIPLLVVPLVLAILVAFGVWLNRFMGITPRQQHFEPRSEEPSTSLPVVASAPNVPSEVPVENGDEGATPPAQ